MLRLLSASLDMQKVTVATGWRAAVHWLQVIEAPMPGTHACIRAPLSIRAAPMPHSHFLAAFTMAAVAIV